MHDLCICEYLFLNDDEIFVTYPCIFLLLLKSDQLLFQLPPLLIQATKFLLLIYKTLENIRNKVKVH